MTRFATLITTILPDSDIPTKLNITAVMWQRIQMNDKYVRPWLMRYVINRYKVNPLYIYGGSEDMLLRER